MKIFRWWKRKKSQKEKKAKEEVREISTKYSEDYNNCYFEEDEYENHCLNGRRIRKRNRKFW